MSMRRDEAEKALKNVIEVLASPEPIEGLKRFQLKATCEYALEQVSAIQEVKRPRRAKEEPA